ncbi:MAG: NAD-dependent epimerase/dehydratase family protein [Halobacteriales archaeon]
MDVLVTGAYGQCGTAIIDHLGGADRYAFTYFNRSDRPDEHPYGGYDTVVGDVADFEALRDAVAGHDAVVHLAGYTDVDSTWEDVHEPNIVGVRNALEAAREASVESFVYASTNHVVGRYEDEEAPEIYQPGHGVVLDRDSEVRPDSFYGTSKLFGERLGRQYAELYDHPEHVYVLRIANVSYADEDYPGNDRLKAMWHSRRDFAHQVDCCLRDDAVDFGVYSGVSDNARRWFSIEHARAEIGYRPRDDGEEWDGELPNGEPGDR